MEETSEVFDDFAAAPTTEAVVEEERSTPTPAPESVVEEEKPAPSPTPVPEPAVEEETPAPPPVSEPPVEEETPLAAPAPAPAPVAAYSRILPGVPTPTRPFRLRFGLRNKM